MTQPSHPNIVEAQNQTVKCKNGQTVININRCQLLHRKPVIFQLLLLTITALTDSICTRNLRFLLTSINYNTF